MAGELKIKPGTRLAIAFDAPLGKQPEFDMVSTFAKALDESAFLISIPMKGGKPLAMDESQKLLIRYGHGEDTMIVAGYPDDTVKEGIRRYWRVRRTGRRRAKAPERPEGRRRTAGPAGGSPPRRRGAGRGAAPVL